jgi:hypothetical protein
MASPAGPREWLGSALNEAALAKEKLFFPVYIERKKTSLSASE